MKTTLQAARIGLSALALAAVAAQGAQFYRIAGPVATTITAVSTDGHITWTNSPTNATFTVQTAQSLGGQVNWIDYVKVPVTHAVPTHWICDPSPPSGMALIPAGSFTMGNCMDPYEGFPEELPLHNVYVSAFYMDTNLVTCALWTNVYHWATNHGYNFDFVATGKATNHPVEFVGWHDAVRWCNARSEMEGLTPCYYTNASLTQMTIYRTGQFELTNDLVNWITNGYRLPTEAEWEKAARGGASGHRFPWSDVDTIDQSRANFYADHFSGAYDIDLTNGYHPTFNDHVQPYTSPVGYFAPNGYGLYDMAGNMGQWCWDCYGLYSSDSQSDPHGPYDPQLRMIRGGYWYYDVEITRTAARDSNTEGTILRPGLRCVRTACR